MSVLRRLADARNTVEGKFLAVLMAAELAVSMCGMPAWADTKADAGQTSAAAEKPANPVISLSLGNGYLVYGAGQIVKAPATKVTAVAGRDFKFVPEADKGYKVASVSLSVQGTQLDLYPNSFGEYVIPAAKLAGGAHLTGGKPHLAPVVQRQPQGDVAVRQRGVLPGLHIAQFPQPAADLVFRRVAFARGHGLVQQPAPPFRVKLFIIPLGPGSLGMCHDGASFARRR